MPTSSAKPFITALSLLTLVSACVEDIDTLDDDEFRSSRGGDDEEEEEPVILCPRYLCGGNAGVGGVASFDLGGGLLGTKRLTSIEDRWGTPMQLEVQQNTLRARYAGGQFLTGSQLAAVGVTLEFIDYAEQSEYSLEIVEAHNHGVNGLLETDRWFATYEFDYIDAGGNRSSFCAGGDWDEGNMQPTRHAIVSQHEAYDWYGNLVHNINTPLSETGNWLSIGCAGGAYAKKVLMGYDLSNPAPLSSNRSENLAMMQMLTARYCGAERYTQTGVEVYWQNQSHWFETPDNFEIEALWDEQGAYCLNTPRFVPRGMVLAECGWMPTCDGFNPEQAMVMSYHVMN